MKFVLTSVLKKLAVIAKKYGDPTKEALNRFYIRDGILNWTHGHFLYQKRVGDVSERSISVTDLKIAADTAKTKKDIVVDISEIDHTDTSNGDRCGQYPDTKTLTSGIESCTEHVGINAHYLKAICEIAIANGQETISLSHPPATNSKAGCVTSAMYITWGKIAMEGKERVLIMPVNLRDGVDLSI